MRPPPIPGPGFGPGFGPGPGIGPGIGPICPAPPIWARALPVVSIKTVTAITKVLVFIFYPFLLIRLFYQSKLVGLFTLQLIFPNLSAQRLPSMANLIMRLKLKRFSPIHRVYEYFS
jgi:hypothetical protein